jgi:hypothetical protein
LYWFILTGTGESDGLRGHMVIRINISHGTIYYKKSKLVLKAMKAESVLPPKA